MLSISFLRLAVSKIRHWISEATYSYMLFPVFALFILVAAWAVILHLIDVERTGAVRTATVLSQELVATYQAQAARALREIDQTLKLVKYTFEIKGEQDALLELKSSALLPADLLFVVSIADRHGDVVASTRTNVMTNIAEQDNFKMARQSDALAVSRPPPGFEELQFSRRLLAVDGSFAGVVTVSVDAAYFVSGYELSQLGAQGVIGLLGTDGVFRARRTGDLVSVGDMVDYSSMAPGAEQDDSAPQVLVSSWDGVRRYTSARKLYDFPLTVIAGLSEEEQLAEYHRHVQLYLWWASASSVMLMLFAVLLARTRWQLDQSHLREIAERKQTENSLRIAAAAFDSQEAMIVTDVHSVILKINRAFTENTGYTPAEVVGKTPSIFKSGRHNAMFYREMWDAIGKQGLWQGEIWDRRKDGTVFPKWMTISAVKDENGEVTNYVGSHYDITERKKSEVRINELAYYDQLTGLPNRTLLMERLRQAITDSHSGGYSALIFIDLDNFKTINDTLGHHVGDLLLKQVAQRLTGCVRADDTVGRLGGDEFVVVLSCLSHSRISAAAQTEVVGNTVLSTLNQKYHLDDVEFHNTPSIGATLFMGPHTSIDNLMKQADLAMYRSKEAGRNAIHFFDPDMESAVMERATLENDLRRAVDEKQFLLHYQPQIEGEDRLTGAEVLVRWQHPKRGMLMPGEFIQLAEDTKLIMPLGNWVMETACAQLAMWATRPEMAHLTLAVNVSAHQFHQNDFVEQALAVLGKTGANPQRLKLELTESLLVSNVDKIIEKMSALKACGVGFSLDDFGTGYSSLSYLKRLPLDQLKIDRSFVSDVLSDPNDAAIANTIIALANSLGMGVIAEGVETVSQRDFLADAGCNNYQGYFFSRPLPLEGFEEYAQMLRAQTVELSESVI
ncbi:MAG: EAL domain-containing protein [Gallionella sp.]|nr:EAL domain-containing protein [Gallionella sp.]